MTDPTGDALRAAKSGRPSDYNVETTTAICTALGLGMSLREICRAEDMPDKSTVMRWLAQNREFRDQYACAREAQADYFAEEIVEISDDGANDTYKDGDGNERTNQDVIARSRLRVDTRKWLMARMAPKKYGDKIVQEHTGPNGGPLETKSSTDNDIAKALLALLTRGAPMIFSGDN